MLGIDDPLIWLPYVLSIACVCVSIWFGVRYWNRNDKNDK